MEKDYIAIKNRFQITTEMFWAPEQAAEYKKEMESIEKTDEIDEDKQPDQVSKHGSEGEHSQEGRAPDYTPLVPEAWKDRCINIGQLHLIKYRRVIQSLLYLLGYNREDVCEKYTNRLEWVKVRSLFSADGEDSVYMRMSEFNPFGPKEDELREFQKLHFIKSNVDHISDEEVQKYSVDFYLLFKWLKLAIQIRTTDVKFRKWQKKQERESRQDAIDREQNRVERKQQELEDAKEQFEKHLEEERNEREARGEDEPEGAEEEKFNEDEFNQKFDEENPPIEIPEEIESDVDNDYDLASDNEEEQE